MKCRPVAGNTRLCVHTHSMCVYIYIYFPPSSLYIWLKHTEPFRTLRFSPVFGGALTTYVHIMCFDTKPLRAARHNETLCLPRLWIYCLTVRVFSLFLFFFSCMRCSAPLVINAGLNCPASLSEDPGFPPSPQPWTLISPQGRPSMPPHTQQRRRRN